MKSNRIRYVFSALCFWMLACAPALWSDPPDRVGRLNFVSGTVSFHEDSVDQWAPATLNYPLTIGDHLWADQDGQAEVHIGSTAIRLASNTEISFLNLNDQTIQIRLSTGSLNMRLRHLAPSDEIELDTPNSSLSLLRAGTYRIDVQQNGDTTVTVRTGEVEVTAGTSVFPLRLRQTAEIAGLDSPTYQVAVALPPDDWDRWCLARDEKEDTIASAQYVPRDQMSGVEDLDQYGSWSVDPDYGPVWAPTVVVVGWAPYRFGRWLWVDPWGWTWVDDAPWGFAPFHYGRWAFRSSAWVWVPGAHVTHPVYAPALVTFVGGGGWRPGVAPGGSVGWFPLGPHEPYIPPYRTDRARLHNVDVEHVAYVNRTVPGALTVVPNETFVRGQPAAGAAFQLTGDDLARAPVRGAVAPLAPQRESFLGSSVASRGAIAQPPAWATSRPVVARLTPPPPGPSFASRQEAFAAHPGRPLDAETMSSVRPSAPAARSPVNIVNPGHPRSGVGQPSFSPRMQGISPRQPGPGQGQNAPPLTRRPQPPEGQPGRVMQPSRRPQTGAGPGGEILPPQGRPRSQPPAGQAGPVAQPSRQPEMNRPPAPARGPSDSNQLWLPNGGNGNGPR